MANFGEALKNKRLEKKLSIEDISKRTKIQKKVLEAIEQGKIEEMLGLIYAKSFIRKYALFLGMDIKEVLKEGKVSKSESSSAVSLALNQRKTKESYNWGKFIPLIKGIIIFLVIIASTIWLVKTARFVHSKVINNNKKKITKPIKAITPSASTHAVVKKATPPPAPAVKITPSRLVLKTKKDVWVQVKSDSRMVFEGFLKKASQEEWTFEKELHLWLGNAAFVELTLNGKYYGSPGKGVIKDIIVTKDGIKVK